MNKHIKRYVRNCHVCRRAKASRDKYNNKLNFLSISERNWQNISLNFVVELQGDRWEGKWEDNLFPSHMREGKLLFFIFLPACEKGSGKISLLACEKKRKESNFFSFFLFSHVPHIIFRIKKNSLTFIDLIYISQ